MPFTADTVDMPVAPHYPAQQVYSTRNIIPLKRQMIKLRLANGQYSSIEDFLSSGNDKGIPVATLTTPQETPEREPIKPASVPEKAQFVGEIHFAFDSTAISDQSIEWISTLPTDLCYYVVAHADQRGTELYNKHLSNARADHIVGLLQASGHSVVGYGGLSWLETRIFGQPYANQRRADIWKDICK